jgi:hypothetical protein
METAFLLLCAGVVGAGIVGATIRTWSILARLYAMENQVAVLERTMTSYVKRESALSKGSRRNVEEELLEKIKKEIPTQPQPWFSRFVHKDLTGT